MPLHCHSIANHCHSTFIPLPFHCHSIAIPLPLLPPSMSTWSPRAPPPPNPLRSQHAASKKGEGARKSLSRKFPEQSYQLQSGTQLKKKTVLQHLQCFSLPPWRGGGRKDPPLTWTPSAPGYNVKSHHFKRAAQILHSTSCNTTCPHQQISIYLPEEISRSDHFKPNNNQISTIIPSYSHSKFEVTTCKKKNMKKQFS